MRRTLAASVGTAAALLLAGWAAVHFYPFEVFNAYRRAALARSGVSRRREGTLMAWEHDACRNGAPCRCVALIHGLGDSALTWDKVLRDPRALAPGVRVLALDMPGTDGSDPPPSPAGYAIPAQAAALRAVLEPRCPRWTVAGNSLGGWTSLRLALDWPQGVERLVLLDAAGIDDPSGRAEASGRILEHPTLESLKKFSARARYKERAAPERAWVSALAAIRARPAAATVKALDRSQLLDARLGAIKAPAAILWGDADGIIPVAVGERLHALIKGSTWELIPKCGHLPQQECPEPVLRALFPAP